MKKFNFLPPAPQMKLSSSKLTRTSVYPIFLNISKLDHHCRMAKEKMPCQGCKTVSNFIILSRGPIFRQLVAGELDKLIVATLVIYQISCGTKVKKQALFTSMANGLKFKKFI